MYKQVHGWSGLLSLIRTSIVLWAILFILTYLILFNKCCSDSVSCCLPHDTCHIIRYAHVHMWDCHTSQWHYPCHFRRNYCGFSDCHHHACFDRDGADVTEIEYYASLYCTVITPTLFSLYVHPPKHQSASLKYENESLTQGQLAQREKMIRDVSIKWSNEGQASSWIKRVKFTLYLIAVEFVM